MAHISYKVQPVTRKELRDLVETLAHLVEEKRVEDPSYTEIVNLVNQIADNLVDAETDIQSSDE